MRKEEFKQVGEKETEIYTHGYYKDKIDRTIFIFEGENIIAALCKAEVFPSSETKREFPKFWKTYTYQKGFYTRYFFSIRTKQESKFLDIWGFDGTNFSKFKSDEEAFKSAFGYLEKNGFR
jgi:hypothetical protein